MNDWPTGSLRRRVRAKIRTSPVRSSRHWPGVLGTRSPLTSNAPGPGRCRTPQRAAPHIRATRARRADCLWGINLGPESPADHAARVRRRARMAAVSYAEESGHGIDGRSSRVGRNLPVDDAGAVAGRPRRPHVAGAGRARGSPWCSLPTTRALTSNALSGASSSRTRRSTHRCGAACLVSAWAQLPPGISIGLRTAGPLPCRPVPGS
jgi:hypothetical protein